MNSITMFIDAPTFKEKKHGITILEVNGDQFALLLMSETDPERIANLADALQRSIKSPVNFSNQEIHLSASIGLVSWSKDVTDPQEMVQNAEIAIALHYLKPRVKNRSREIDSRAKQLLKTLKSQQLGDGSWVGENIWTFLHRTHSQPAVGFDSFRVHSTSLCVQALRYWN